MLHRTWSTGDETFYLVHTLNIVGTDKWKSLQEYGADKAHALFDYDHDNDCYWLRDLSAKGGVRVNGIPISKSDPVRLKNGDRISFAQSPEYIFAGTTPPVDRRRPLGMYMSQNSSRGYRHHSSDNGIKMAGALAVDSAPSANGASNGTADFRTLPKLGRGRSPAVRQTLAQLPVATLVDGRHINNGSDVENGDTTLKNSSRSPSTLTYRQRHFLRNASADSHTLVSPPKSNRSENRRRAIPHAWSENRDTKYGMDTSPSSSGSYGDGTLRHSNRHGSSSNGSGFLRTHQSNVIRQLQKRVQQLEDDLRLNHQNGTIGIHAGDSGISSATTAPTNGNLVSETHQDVINFESVPPQRSNEKQHCSPKPHWHVHNEAHDMARELRKLETALAASERRRARLENMLQNTNRSYHKRLAPSEIHTNKQTEQIFLVGPSSPQVANANEHPTGSACTNSAVGDGSVNESLSSCDQSTNLNEYNNNQSIIQNNNGHAIASECNICAPADDTADDANENGQVEKAINAISEPHNCVSGTEQEEIESKVQQCSATEAIELPDSTAPAAVLDQPIAGSPEKQLEKEFQVQKCRVRALLFLQSIFVDELSLLPEKILNDPLFKLEQLLSRTIEEKKELYALSLHRLISNAKCLNEFQEPAHADLGEDFLDKLCVWALEQCTPVVEAAHSLMPKVVELLKKRTNDADVQGTLESWLHDFETQFQNDEITPAHLQESADLLKLYGEEYWQLRLLVSLLKFLGARFPLKRDADVRNAEMITDISHADFSKLVGDIADLLDEKETLRTEKSKLEIDLAEKCTQLEKLSQDFSELATDKSLLQEDNHHLTDVASKLQQQNAQLQGELEKKAQEFQMARQYLMDENAAYQQRVAELDAENVRLKQNLTHLTQADAPEEMPKSFAPNHETNEKTPDPEHAHSRTASAREELEYLKRKLIELETAGAEVDENADRMNQLEDEKRFLEEALQDLTEKLNEKDQLSAQLENRLCELENENSQLKRQLQAADNESLHEESQQTVPPNDQSTQGAILQSPSESLSVENSRQAATGEGTDDTMFWTLSKHLASLLNSDISRPGETDLAVQNQQNEDSQWFEMDNKDPAKTAHEITDKVQQLLDRVRRQNEQLVTYRSLTSSHLENCSPNNSEMTSTSQYTPAYLASILTNGHAHPFNENVITNGDTVDDHQSLDEERRPQRRSRSGSLRLRRHRSPSPRIPYSTSAHHGARECHACNVLSARRKQNELLQAAESQAVALATRQLDTYPLKIVTFKLPGATEQYQNGEGLNSNLNAL